MSVAGAREVPEPDQAVPHEEWLLRLNFNPEHINNGEVVPSAVSLSDLKSRGYSVDREHLVDIRLIASRASAQSANKPELRQSSFLSKFECGPVCGEVDADGKTAFLVEASPVVETEDRAANPAHAHIKSAIQRGESALRKIRMILLPHLQRLIALEDYMRTANNDDTANSTKPDSADVALPSDAGGEEEGQAPARG